MKRERPASASALYAGACAISVLCVWILDGLWRANLRFPLVPLAGDALLTQAVVFKGLVDNPWYLDNRWLGAPFGMNLRDLPQPDLLVLAVTKMLALFTKNHHLIRNLVAIGSYPLVTVTSLYVMRRLGIRSFFALPASLLYAFLSFHQVQLDTRMLAGIGYFTVPLATLLAITLFENHAVFITHDAGAPRWRFIANRDTQLAVGWCLLMGLTGTVDFPIFSGFVLAVAGVAAAIRFGSRLPALRSACMVFWVVAALVINQLPQLWNGWSHGRIPVVEQLPQAIEAKALRITQLMIPGAGHRLPALQRLSDLYGRATSASSANRGAYLGGVAIIGFVYLLYALMRSDQRDGRIRTLSILNIAVLLLGTAGGFSSVIAFWLPNSVGNYGYLSVYVAFFALLALALLAEGASAKSGLTKALRIVMGFAVASLLCLGLFDQNAAEVDYDALRKYYTERAHFIRRIERSVPANSGIFQFPHQEFPDYAGRGNEYAALGPYLHSSKLKWSYGATKGRRSGEWNAKVASMPTDQAVNNLVLAGFSGVYVARDAYSDRGAQLESALKSLLGKPSAVDRAGDAAFYSLVGRAQTLRQSLGEKEFDRRRAESLYPPHWGWLDGCYPPESLAGTPRIWCRASFRFVIENPSERAMHVVIEAKLHIAKVPVELQFHSDVLNRQIRISRLPYDLSEGFDVPPGEHIFTADTTGSGRIDDDRRDLHLAFDDPHFSSVVR